MGRPGRDIDGEAEPLENFHRCRSPSFSLLSIILVALYSSPSILIPSATSTIVIIILHHEYKYHYAEGEGHGKAKGGKDIKLQQRRRK